VDVGIVGARTALLAHRRERRKRALVIVGIDGVWWWKREVEGRGRRGEGNNSASSMTSSMTHDDLQLLD